MHKVLLGSEFNTQDYGRREKKEKARNSTDLVSSSQV
jgi:hypothetical protein